MKTRPALLFVAVLAASSLFASDKDAQPTNVVVTFHEPEKFTDARSRFASDTDQGYLDIINEHLQKAAGRRLAPGQKLEITINDVDLAGDFLPVRPQMDQIRIIKDVYIPRVSLTFKLIDADGKVLKEGERKLSDMSFMSNASLIGRNEPLFYDKTMLTEWVDKEFKS